jgi:hypothetical protein
MGRAAESVDASGGREMTCGFDSESVEESEEKREGLERSWQCDLRRMVGPSVEWKGGRDQNEGRHVRASERKMF